MTSKAYIVNEIFYSLQGEGRRTGEPSIFVRFSGCNLRCDTKAGKKASGASVAILNLLAGLV